MIGAARLAILVSTGILTAACASNPPARPTASVDYRGGAPAASAPTTKPKPQPALPQPSKRVGGAPRSAAPGESASPAVIEAAAMRPETNTRPGGALKQPSTTLADRAVVIKPGDSLHQISERYSVNVRALAETNGLSEPYILKAGKTIYLPAPNIHVVERGETLFSVGQRYNIDTRSLALMNGLARPWTVWPGDELLLPPLAKDQTLIAELAAAVEPAAAPQGAKTAPIAPAASRPVATGRMATNEAGQLTFIWPVTGPILLAFGADADGVRNDGVNIGAPPGADVKAAQAGEVVFASNELAGFRNLVLVKHEGGWVTAYAYADTMLVKVGDRVTQGQPVARTGFGPSPQVHFELRQGKQPVDPEGVVGR